MWCTCPDPKCRVYWSCHKIGGWRVIIQDPSWGEMPMTFHPADEDVARWVANNHGVDCTWVLPQDTEVSNGERVCCITT